MSTVGETISCKVTGTKEARAGPQQHLDPWTAWAYKPHTLTALFLGACTLVYWTNPLGPEEEQLDPVQNARAGVIAMIAVFLGYCILQAPDTILIRPHPAVWRLAHGLAVVYMVALTFLLFQNRTDARQLLRHLSPELGHELPERSYGADCRIYTPENPNKFHNVWAVLNDEFVIAHILGWWGKTIMIRNYFLCWVLSIMFEVMEVTFHHMLPNFSECWWDSVVVDVLLCNFLGIWLGMKAVNYFDGKKYTWVGLSEQPTFMAKFRRSLGQFTPASWDSDTWNAMSGPKRFIQVLALVIVVLVVEVNAFFLKFCLWVPPRNLLNTYRLVLWWLIANPAIREYNHFLSHREIKKLGAFCWLSLANCILEVLVCVKFGRGLYPQAMPAFVKWFWIAATLSICVFVLGWVVLDYRRSVAQALKRKPKSS